MGVHHRGLVLACGCKKKEVNPPPAAIVDAGSDASATATDAGPKKPYVPGSDIALRLGMSAPAAEDALDEIAVSSRVENDTETPNALVDQNLETAWSSRTGDLEGAWVAMKVNSKARIDALHMPEAYEGMLEVRWSADGSFVALLENDQMQATAPFIANVRSLAPSLWLVERIRSHGSEGVFWSEHNAFLCSGATKTCAVGYR